MGDTHYGNAMTEVALALAMAFFSIMILAMVTMGAGGMEAAAARDAAAKAVAAKLAPAAANTAPAAATAPTPDDTLLIYHGGRFLDRDLKPVEPAGMTFPGRVILALSPDVAMSEALRARTRIGTENLVVSVLNDDWLGALDRPQAKEN